jgi:hypothetical protein
MTITDLQKHVGQTGTSYDMLCSGENCMKYCTQRRKKTMKIVFVGVISKVYEYIYRSMNLFFENTSLTAAVNRFMSLYKLGLYTASIYTHSSYGSPSQLQSSIIPSRPSSNYMNHLLWQSVMLHFVFIGFCMALNVNSDYFLKQHQPVELCNGDVWCSLWGMDWILK